MHSRSWFALCLVLFLALWNSESIAQEEHPRLVMVFPEEPDNALSRWLRLSYEDAFRRLGYTLVYRHYPAPRCTLLARTGAVDGELGRIHSYGDQYQSLVRVEDSPFATRVVAYATNPTLKVNGWESLRNRSLRVMYLRGIKISEDNLPRVVSPFNLRVADSVHDGLRSLIAGYADLYVDEEISSLSALRHLQNTRDIPVHTAGVLDSITLYAYMAERHRDLAPRLAETLRQMIREGRIEEYRRFAFSQDRGE